MKKLLGFLIVVAVIIILAYRWGGQGEDVQITPEDEVFCTMEYAPVCGVDGNTYSNRCVAEEQNDVEVDYEGECILEDDTEDSDTENMTGNVSTGDAQDNESDMETEVEILIEGATAN